MLTTANIHTRKLYNHETYEYQKMEKKLSLFKEQLFIRRYNKEESRIHYFLDIHAIDTET